MDRTRRFFAAVFGLLLIWSLPGRLTAQVAGGTLSGTITDPSGAVVPKAQIAIKNLSTGITRAVTTNSDGFYAAPNLLPGEYTLSCTAPGFSGATGHTTITVGAEKVSDFQLGVGQPQQNVVVQSEAVGVQFATSDLGGVVGATTVEELPLNGRSWTDLAALEPGISGVETQPAFTDPARGNRGFGSQLVIAGARPQNSNYRLDGISLNDYSNGGPGSVLGGSLGVDAVLEFSVLTTNAPAEYGRTAGGVVNATTKSGTNAFQGTAYEFLRNSALDAKNFFDVGTIPPFERNQFGGSIGGPIIRDQTFFFADYEGIRQAKGITTVDTVPSPAARTGNLSTGKVVVDPSVQKYLGLYPLPNGPLLQGGDTDIYTFAAQQIVNENFFTGRLDHRFSDEDSLFRTYLFDKAPFLTPDTLNDIQNGSLTERQAMVLEETHIFTPSFVNSLRVGFNKDL
ncbi:MAG: carboxypeptidase regulatory-like domain-containing protein [Bryobacteraceae bacterium]